MRFIVALLGMGMLALTAAALVVVDMIIKLLPLLICALVALVAVRVWQRRRRGAAALSIAPPAQCNVPGAAALGWPSRSAGICISHPSGVGKLVPMRRRYSAPYPLDPTVIDAEVIDAEVVGEDDHRG